MATRWISIDTNVATNLFHEGRDYSALRLAKVLHAHDLHLSVPELALGQMLIGSAEARRQRLRNLLELARCAGPGYVSVGAPLYRTFEYELLTGELPGLLHSHGGIFAALTEAERNFDAWHAALVAETRAHIDREGWRALDDRTHRLVMSGSVEALGAAPPQRHRAEWLHSWLHDVPANLETVLTMLGKRWRSDEAGRARMLAEPERFRAHFALALASTLNMLGAAMNLCGHHEFDFLRAEDDSWTDAQILAASAYADCFVTEDARLRERAALIARWGHYRPRVCSWFELTGHHWEPRLAVR